MGLSRGLVYYTDGEGPLLAFDPDIWVAPTGGFAGRGRSASLRL